MMPNQYKDYCKPKLAELLTALRLDQVYNRAEGSYLYPQNGPPVLDLIGGFGTVLAGHNHPELKKALIDAVSRNIPMNAQVSTRAEAATLAQRLNELIPGKTGYYVNFTNSGTESVEAALKHAYKVHLDTVRRAYEKYTRILNDLYYRIEREGLEVELPEGKATLTKFRDDLDEYNLAQFERVQDFPAVAAIKGAFHGKTASSLKVTFNKSFRESFEGLSSIQPVFIDLNQPERLEDAVKNHYVQFYYPILENGRVVLRSARMTQVIAFIMEVILGEGGILIVSDAVLDTLAGLHDKLKVPFIIDEIQTGSGRTGAICAFSQTALSRIEPEYITLSKALGGGMVKIGATLIKKSIYDEDFGILHTSTFGEDEISSHVSLKYLDILTRDHNRFLDEVVVKGDYFRERLRTLQERYPDIIKDVRGRGLMIGVELTHLNEYAPFFRAAGKQGVLALLIASYLLKYHHIRVLAPLTTVLKGNPGKERQSILRIQPPGTITNEEINRCIHALDEVFQVISRNNEFCLVGHLSGQMVQREHRDDPISMPVTWKVDETRGQQHIDARTGFVVHPTELRHLMDYYFPSFAHYRWEPTCMEQWWNRLSRFLEPVYAHSSNIISQDFVLENNLVFVPFLPASLTNLKPGPRLQEIQDKIQDAVTIARELGDDNIPTTVVGLGAYTSIVTNNGMTINDYEVPVTTGNAYTAALVLQGIEKAAEERGIDITEASVAVVGATGNIGLVLAQVLARHAGQLCLIGRPGESGSFRLNYSRQHCFQTVFNMVHQESAEGIDLNETTLSGFARELSTFLRTKITQEESEDSQALAMLRAGLQSPLPPSGMGKCFEALLVEHFGSGDSCGITLHTDPEVLRSCEVVVVATNSPDANLINPENLKVGSVICCASVPSNLSRTLVGRQDDFYAFDGGLARLPEDSAINFVGMPGGQLAYGCVAETLLVGFEGCNHSFCKNLLEIDQVLRTVDMADRHGFSLGDFKLDDKFVNQANSCR
jgi:acetylornithine/succinyldiaminopimelate/putrescine aminotransferase/predicted amino acid dehydrogenase